MKLFRMLLNAALIVFLIHSGAVFSNEVIHFATGYYPLQIVVIPTGLIVLFSAPLLWLAMVISPRVPKTVFGPIVLLIAWSMVGAMPLPIFLGLKFGLALSAIQLAVAIGIAIRAGMIGDGRQPLVTAQILADGPFLSWKNSLAIVALTFMGGPPALAVYGFVSLDLAASRYSADFIGLNLSGLEVAHKTYTKGDKTIDLIGMAHIGDQKVYDTMFDGIEPNDRTVLLEEGVSDAKGHLGSGPLYDAMAERVGLATQQRMDRMTELKIENADIDVDEFSEDTLEILGLALEIYRADDPRPPLIAYVTFAQNLEDPDAMGIQVYEDLVILRNESVMTHLHEALKDHDRIVIPWGAIHMLDLEPRILDMGYTEVSDIRHTIVPFRLLVGR